MKTADGRGRIVYINPNSTTLPLLHTDEISKIFAWMGEEGLYILTQIFPTSSLLHPGQALEIFFMNGKGRDVYKFLGRLNSSPTPSIPEQASDWSGPPIKASPSFRSSTSTTMCGTLPGQTVSRFFIGGENHLCAAVIFLHVWLCRAPTFSNSKSIRRQHLNRAPSFQ